MPYLERFGDLYFLIFISHNEFTEEHDSISIRELLSWFNSGSDI